MFYAPTNGMCVSAYMMLPDDPLPPSLVLRLSPHANPLFRTASDGKLGGAWEQGYLPPAMEGTFPRGCWLVFYSLV